MEQYLSLVQDVLDNGEVRSDRTGVGTLSVFGTHSRYDLRNGFPIVTTKKILFDKVVDELLWFISGSTSVNELPSRSQVIWKPWADDEGDLGPVYGKQFRNWTPGNIDQLATVIKQIKTDSHSRRILLTTWNVSELSFMQLPPCHGIAIQFYVANGYLDCQMYQRSADIALGVPFNISSYSLLLAMIAQECRMTPRYFIHCIGDAHIYLNHVDGLKEQLTRNPLPLPTLELEDKPVVDMEFDDINLVGYRHHPFIKFPVAV